MRFGNSLISEDLGGALHHIAEQGSLLRFVTDLAGRLELTKLLSERGLIVWNMEQGRYELTDSGRDYLSCPSE
jgi:hypothetical protein